MNKEEGEKKKQLNGGKEKWIYEEIPSIIFD